MKLTLQILCVLALGLMVFNLIKINWESPLEGNSSIAAIGAMASASAFLLLVILIRARKISDMLKKK